MRHMTVFTIQSILHNSPPPLASLCITVAYFAGHAVTSRLFRNNYTAWKYTLQLATREPNPTHKWTITEDITITFY